MHARAANQRRDALHQLTTGLATQHGTVVVEQLNVEAKLTLAERTFGCEACGLRIDRDVNAARNLANLVESVTQSGWETRNARGADVRPGLAGLTATKREAGTEHRSGKTGIVQPQGWTA